MSSNSPQRFTDAQRMELRSYVQLAGEVISSYWPMRTFIHHNPLHGLESMSFEQAVKRGAQLFGGRGYLSNETFREYLRQGRIRSSDLRTVLSPLAADKEVMLGDRRTTHLDVLTASMRHGITEPFLSGQGTEDEAAGDPELIDTIARRLAMVMHGRPAGASAPQCDSIAVPSRETLSAWCDQTLGTTIVQTINQELVKWCSAFLDEGEAGWAMPRRDQTFFRAWKSLAQYDGIFRCLGLKQARQRIRALPDRTEDAVLDSLGELAIPKPVWEEYLSLHMAALPGWTGFIKWRSTQNNYAWQQQFPIDLVKYLAVRLFYERELVEHSCRNRLGIAGTYDEIRRFMDGQPYAYWLRREWVAGRLSPAGSGLAQQLARSNRQFEPSAWEELGRAQFELQAEEDEQQVHRQSARALARLTSALSITPAAIESTSPSDILTVLDWLAGFPPSQQGPRWLEAFEAHHRRQQLRDLGAASARLGDLPLPQGDGLSRPLAQVIFCIDVRSEVFRRHLEHRGGYETLGLAGFFGVPLEYQAFSMQSTVSQCPVLLKPKNQIREVPRSYHGTLAERHKTAARLGAAGHLLLHDLKENVVTPYVMVEALGWFFSLPLFGKTLFPRWYHNSIRWVKQLLLPSVATTLTVEKISRQAADDMITTEQHAHIREILRERFGLRGTALSPALLDQIRKNAIGHADGAAGEVGRALGLDPEREEAFYRELRERYRISLRGISERLNRLTRTGFSITEQAYFVEAALRLMGLTSNFARVVLFCAHGSTSQNNPYESALDCGACGGNHGLPNARTIATMGNNLTVREILLGRGIKIPSDTHFCAAQHDTTSDQVRVVDLEDAPPTHRKDLQRLMADLEEAGAQSAHERGIRLEANQETSQTHAARQLAGRRSEHWAEVRPEWGLSRNSLMVIGRRALTQSVDLQGRAFLHSYDYRQDASGKLLEAIMTAPLVVAQWINMEHYFSTVDNEIYGSGSKAYHNVVGRIGVMTGGTSDLRIGLPAQTVLKGTRPYHEPMRLLAVIEAPRARIQSIIDQHPHLEQLVTQRWITVAALNPEDHTFDLYDSMAGWIRGGTEDDQFDIAFDEGDQDRSSGGTCDARH
ncbi:MAG: hypothetical protein K0S45_2524 [Nitrospira sp.]|nr:hypothetical protein [Nitrospira sp.]